MKLGRSIQTITILAAAFLPMAAFAGTSTASVTVAPGSTSAPAMSIVLLGLLAIVLSAAAVILLRKRSPVLRAGLVIAIAVTFAAIGQAADIQQIVTGEECNQQTVKPYFPGGLATLKSNCPNPIVVVDTDIDCRNGDVLFEQPLPMCVVGLVLNPGDICVLDVCPS